MAIKIQDKLPMIPNISAIIKPHFLPTLEKKLPEIIAPKIAPNGTMAFKRPVYMLVEDSDHLKICLRSINKKLSSPSLYPTKKLSKAGIEDKCQK